MTEQVLVFREAVLNEVLPGFEGVLAGEAAKAAADQLLDPTNLFYRSRPHAEVDPTLKQVIPYIVVRNGDRILSYERTKKGGEARLHSKRSIGFGGHINPHDGDGGIAYEKCFWRELAEELSLERQVNESMPAPAAVVYETQTDVGKVHFGIVHVLDVSDSFTWQPEADASVGDVKWLEIQSLKADSGAYENWSKMVIESVL